MARLHRYQTALRARCARHRTLPVRAARDVALRPMLRCVRGTPHPGDAAFEGPSIRGKPCLRDAASAGRRAFVLSCRVIAVCQSAVLVVHLHVAFSRHVFLPCFRAARKSPHIRQLPAASRSSNCFAVRTASGAYFFWRTITSRCMTSSSVMPSESRLRPAIAPSYSGSSARHFLYFSSAFFFRASSVGVVVV